MRNMARVARSDFGRAVELTRAEPVVIAKHGRQVAAATVVEEFTRLNTPDPLRVWDGWAPKEKRSQRSVRDGAARFCLPGSFLSR
jgi:hypothetical protein